jgi:hypothetical protein
VKVHQGAGDPGDRAEPLVRLAAQVDRLAHELATVVETLPGLRGDVDTHTRTLADLTDLLRRVTSTTGQGGDRRGSSDPSTEAELAAPEWMTVTDPQDAIGWLSALTVWVRDVFARYASVAPCWPWHPPVVAELLACQAAWVAATHPDAPLEALAGWHDRWRPGTTTRVTKALTGCERTDRLHVEGVIRYDFDLSRLDEYAFWWSATHHGDGSQAPGLTLNREVRR